MLQAMSTATPPAAAEANCGAPGEALSAPLRAGQDDVARSVAALGVEVAALGAEVAQIDVKLADLSAADRAGLSWKGAVQGELDAHARPIGALEVESSKGLRVGEMKLCADELKRKREQTSIELLRDVVRDQSAALVRMCATASAHDGLALQYQGDLLSKLNAQLLEAGAPSVKLEGGEEQPGPELKWQGGRAWKRAHTLAAACAGPAPAAGGAAPAAASGGACVCGRPGCRD